MSLTIALNLALVSFGPRRTREGRVREPWRWDEPVEKVVWYKEEGDYDDEDEEEMGDSGEEDGDEDGYGEDD